MKIALDYDDTFTRDRSLFSAFVGEALHSGHEVKFVTARYSNRSNNDIRRDAITLGIEIIFTDGRKKKPVMSEFAWLPDIWIDDNPDNIVATKRAMASDLI